LNEYGKTILILKIFFKTNLSVLESITSILKEYPNSKFMIEGTWIVTVVMLNQTLSENRAAAVRNYLVEEGIGTDRF
jgi:outer membrane protein OmpA-like peptidoglycan-associated protein